MDRFIMFEDLNVGGWVVRDTEYARDVASNMTENQARSLMNWKTSQLQSRMKQQS